MSVESLLDQGHDLLSDIDEPIITIYDPKIHASFTLGEAFWLNISWPLELARRIVSYKYTIPIFDVIYVSMVIFYVIRYYSFYREYFGGDYFVFHNSGNGLFFVFFVIETAINTLAPPLCMRLLRDMFTDEAVSKIVENALHYDKHLRIKMCLVSYMNLLGFLIVMVLTATVTDFYDNSTLPMIALYSLPVEGAVSLVVVVLNAYRLLQLDFITNILQTHHTKQQDDPPVHRFSYISAHPSDATNTPLYYPRDELVIHMVDIRLRYLALHKQLETAGQRWGRVFFLLICGITMYIAYLVTLAYKVSGLSIGPLMPYIAMACVALCEIVISLSLVNETGMKVRRGIAKHVLEFAGNKALSCDCQDIAVLLACAEALPLEIYFIEGFSLKFRLAAAILGPIVFALVPRLVSW